MACHNASYISRYDIVTELKPNGAFLLNCGWDSTELDEQLPARVKRTLAENNIRFYTIDATKIATEIGLGNRTNTVLQAAFFKLSNILPIEGAVNHMKEAIKKTYSAKGEKILAMNYAAVDRGVSDIVEVEVPASWLEAKDILPEANIDEPDYIHNVLRPINSLKGDELPVSIFSNMADGTVPLGTSAYEKRGIANNVPSWVAENCIQCNQCSLVCPHAAIRPFLLNKEEAEAAPSGYDVQKAKGKGLEQYSFRLQISPLDCTGCGSCVSVCPAKQKALVMQPQASQLSENINWNYSLSLSDKANPIDKFTIKGSQFEPPLLEFSGACAGCGETSYIKLATPLHLKLCLI